jgi:hypothetical protein
MLTALLNHSSSSSRSIPEQSNLWRSLQIRNYTPMTKQEEEIEKQRVAGLSPFQKDQELRELNRQIAKLEMLRGINTGELYTWRGRYKDLSRNYGIPLMMWYGTCWVTTGLLVYTAVELGGIDAMTVLARIDDYMGFDLASKVDPNLGKIGLILVLNEMLEPLRLPIVILTCKPVVDRIAPTKY